MQCCCDVCGRVFVLREFVCVCVWSGWWLCVSVMLCVLCVRLCVFVFLRVPVHVGVCLCLVLRCEAPKR